MCFSYKLKFHTECIWVTKFMCLEISKSQTTALVGWEAFKAFIRGPIISSIRSKWTF